MPSPDDIHLLPPGELPRTVPSDPSAASDERAVRTRIEEMTRERDIAMGRQAAARLRDDESLALLGGSFAMQVNEAKDARIAELEAMVADLKDTIDGLEIELAEAYDT